MGATNLSQTMTVIAALPPLHHSAATSSSRHLQFHQDHLHSNFQSPTMLLNCKVYHGFQGTRAVRGARGMVRVQDGASPQQSTSNEYQASSHHAQWCAQPDCGLTFLQDQNGQRSFLQDALEQGRSVQCRSHCMTHHS